MEELFFDNVVYYLNEGMLCYGKEDFVVFMEKMDEFYEEILKDLIFFQGEVLYWVVVEFIVYGIYKKVEVGFFVVYGQQYVLLVGVFLEVENGVIIWIIIYYNFQQWILLVF